MLDGTDENKHQDLNKGGMYDGANAKLYSLTRNCGRNRRKKQSNDSARMYLLERQSGMDQEHLNIIDARRYTYMLTPCEVTFTTCAAG